MNYDVDYKKLVKWLIPIPILGKRIVAFIGVMVYELKTIYQNILRNRENFIYYLSITPQVVYLEKMLNDRYDPFTRGIHIDDGQSFDPIYHYKKLEDKPVYVFKKSESEPLIYLYTKSETGNDASDFVVNVPVGVVFNEAEMKSLIDTFKLAGTVYKIVVD